jgi:hypothetical protein
VCGEQGGFTLMNVVKLVCVFTAWYGFNIYFNIYNKQLLKMFPYPISATAFQFLGGTVIACVMWLFNLHEKPKGVRAPAPHSSPLTVAPAQPHPAAGMSRSSLQSCGRHPRVDLHPRKPPASRRNHVPRRCKVLTCDA